ncbi:MAG: hypothetical protein LBQ76_06075 [Candidatus Fibromonas sp.]|jgi:hypothetical protein|nr:hypothetical protein [Candidatus Fibromonas sp.]
MKKIVSFLALFFGISFAQANNNAVGFFLHDGGNNWGVDFKHLDNYKNAWNIYLNDLRFGNTNAVGLSFGYYFLYNVIKADASAGRFPIYWGPNIGFGYWSGGDKPSRYSGLDVGINLTGGVSWFLPTSFRMDLSFELLSPNLGHWHQRNEQPDSGNWKTTSDPAFGLKGSLGFRILFHAYLF